MAKTPRQPRRKGNNRTPIELTIEREAQAWELHKQGYSQAEIANLMSLADPDHPVGQQAVSKMLHRVQDTVAQGLSEKIERHKASQLGRLEGIFLQAMSSYRHSKAAKNGIDTPGDPRWLEKAMEALRDARKIQGIDAPLKFDGTVKTDRPLEDLTDDELMAEHIQLQARLAGVKKRRGK